MGSPHDLQTASAEQLRQVLSGAHLLLVDHDAATADSISGVLKRYGASAIERASSADEALDMLGYSSRPYDLVMLRAGLPADQAGHVLRVLVRQRARLRVTLHGQEDLALLVDPETYVGVARCIDTTGLPGIVRGVAIVLASPVTIAAIFKADEVPDTLSADWAQAIYGALPGAPLPRRSQPRT